MSKNEDIKDAIVGKIMERYVYAAIDDIRDEWSMDDVFPTATYYTYTEIQLPPKERAKKTRVCSIPPDVKRICAGMLTKMARDELNAIEIAADATLDDINASCKVEITNSYFCMVKDVVAAHERGFKGRLANARDNEQYLLAKLFALMSEHRSKDKMITRVASLVDDFLRIVCQKFAVMIWYMRIRVNQDSLFALMAMFGVDQETIDELFVFTTAKKPRAPRRKKSADSASNTPPLPTTSPPASFQLDTAEHSQDEQAEDDPDDE